MKFFFNCWIEYWFWAGVNDSFFEKLYFVQLLNFYFMYKIIILTSSQSKDTWESFSKPSFLYSDILPKFLKLSPVGVFGVEVIFFLYLSPSFCVSCISSNSQSFLCILALACSMIALFLEIWTILYKTWVLVFWALNFILKF